MSDDIQRHQSNERLSRVVVHNGVVYVAGCTATDRSGDAQALIIGATRRTFKFQPKIRPRASPFGPDAARLAARRAAPPRLDFARRLIYTLSLEFSRVANPAEE